MSSPPLIERQHELLDNLARLAAERVANESRAQTELLDRNRAIEQEFQSKREQFITSFDSSRHSLEREYEQIRLAANADYDTNFHDKQREFSEKREFILARHESDSERIKRELHDARWEATTLSEALKNDAKKLYREHKVANSALVSRLRAIEDEAVRLLDEWRQPRGYSPTEFVPPDAPQENELRTQLEQRITDADSKLNELKKLTLPKVFKGNRVRWALGSLWVGIIVLAFGTMIGRGRSLDIIDIGVVLALGSSAAALIGWGTSALLFALARAQVAAIYQPLCQAIADADAISDLYGKTAAGNYKRRRKEISERHSREVHTAQEKAAKKRIEIKQARDTQLREAEETYPRQLWVITERRDSQLSQAEQKYPRLLTEQQVTFEQSMRDLERHHQEQLAASRGQHEADWKSIVQNWTDGLARIRDEIVQLNQRAHELFPDWSELAADDWKPPAEVPPVMRFGQFQVEMDKIPHGVPKDERLKASVLDDFALPALVPFPAGCSMVFKAADAGRAKAVVGLQAVMLRLLASVPPGKVRFTIVDPVGLGENFAAFMHLADYEDALVTNRIWTEPQHIDHRLADITEHMENVIQKYLRNEYETIEEYNAQAGEVAEPFRFVVVANFPANFNEATARRLVSIASSGARCGVYVLVSVDTKLPMPHGFHLSDLEQYAATLVWQDDRFIWQDPKLEQFPLTIDTPPNSETFTQVLHTVGVKAKEASRVEVPFEFVAPAAERYWTGDSRSGISVPLGRSGATKMQMMRLGQGTSQHVLIAGKTGSGKSTLLHALITNLSLLYSPDEVQLYLVDFKKGVEFKTYATYELPHARVVAIESEREFGLSVLQRLDSELKRRGDQYREVGAQDLASYRQSAGSSLPRILLIVDEFQEFFVEDDKIAQEAALLLDRLVRQGRAFGIHVQLGSQTLGGAYSLARSTLGQMAVRIALQCSEADAHLILSDDNTAARLLSRPGEAIYNDANGLIEGNNFFQVVWLPDERREQYLRRIQEMAQQRGYAAPVPQIVFEGNTPSEIGKNHLLARVLRDATWPSPRGSQAWLGEAVAIKDPTAAMFRAQSGSNLVIMGQRDESALGIMTSSLISLAAQHAPGDPAREPAVSLVPSESDSGTETEMGDTTPEPVSNGQPTGCRFFILDGSSQDSASSGHFARMAELLPHPIEVAAPRDCGRVIASIAAELDRRQKMSDGELPPIFLFIYDLQRFRDLRKQDDDFGFSRRGEERQVSPAKALGNILREGASLRIHTIIWCDSVNNWNRTFDRQAMREFDLRVLFQMSAGDSSTLIDSPVAAKLGVHRAIFFSEEQGQIEKFRPYGLPARQWLESAAALLAGRAASVPAST